jgi:hypothetical protein
MSGGPPPLPGDKYAVINNLHGVYVRKKCHNKGFIAKYVQINELAPQGVYLRAGLACFDLYIQYSGLSKTNFQVGREIYLLCYVLVGGLSRGLGA